MKNYKITTTKLKKTTIYNLIVNGSSTSYIFINLDDLKSFIKRFNLDKTTQEVLNMPQI